MAHPLGNLAAQEVAGEMTDIPDFTPPLIQFLRFRALALEFLRQNGGLIVLDPDKMHIVGPQVLVRDLDDGCVEFSVIEETMH